MGLLICGTGAPSGVQGPRHYVRMLPYLNELSRLKQCFTTIKNHIWPSRDFNLHTLVSCWSCCLILCVCVNWKVEVYAGKSNRKSKETSYKIIINKRRRFKLNIYIYSRECLLSTVTAHKRNRWCAEITPTQFQTETGVGLIFRLLFCSHHLFVSAGNISAAEFQIHPVDDHRVIVNITDPLTGLHERGKQFSIRDILKKDLKYKVSYYKSGSTGKVMCSALFFYPI